MKLNLLAEIARQDPKVKFTSLAHLSDEQWLKERSLALNPYVAAGINRVSYESYGEDLREERHRPFRDRKLALTAKLSRNLVLGLRQYAKGTGGTLAGVSGIIFSDRRKPAPNKHFRRSAL
ncbi:MAG: hypothetical protein JRF50_16590 [Deltaproteobacteria bacterium]|nr:hypothetical protein [Deltaproteobacteria bacterium]